MQNIAKVLVYIDDLLIHACSHPEQLIVLDAVFRKLVENGLKINLDKCVFRNTSVSYLGFTLTSKGISHGKDILKAIKEAKPPTDIKMVRSFIGLCNFFRTHINIFAKLCLPLHNLTRKESTYKGGGDPSTRSNESFRTSQISTNFIPCSSLPSIRQAICTHC